ncbi:MAG: prepilin-type N-terminal cleavage/methylation domain-containing protein [Candidatus Thioglobus sp.]
MFPNRKAFTLVEMLVALAVSSIVIIAAYASYDMVKTQYEKNIGIADMHTSGRAVMRIIERDIRMAGYEHQDSLGDKTFSTGITSQLVLSESNNACCDGVSVIYDHPTDAVDGVERRRITYSVKAFPGTEEVSYKLLDSDTDRYRLYKKIDVLGRDGIILPAEESGTEQVLADFVEDFQLNNTTGKIYLYVINYLDYRVDVYDANTKEFLYQIHTGYRPKWIALGPDGLLYVNVWRRYDRVIRVFDPKTGREVVDKFGTGLQGGIAFGPDGLLYAAANNSDINVFDPKTKMIDRVLRPPLLRTMTVGGTGNSEMVFGPDGLLYIVYNGPGNYIRKIDPKSGKVIGGFKSRRPEFITTLTFSPDGLLYESGSPQIRGYDPVTGEFVKGYSTPRGSGYRGLAFSPDGLLYACRRGRDAIIDIFDTKKYFSTIGELKTKNRCGEIILDTSSFKVSALVNIKLTLRSKNKQHTADKTYIKVVDEEHHIGNYNFEFNDKYKRDVFFSTVAVRNMLL